MSIKISVSYIIKDMRRKTISIILLLLFFTQCSSTTVLESAASSCNLESSANVDVVSIRSDGNFLVLRLKEERIAETELEDFFCMMEELDLDLALFNKRFEENTVETSGNITTGDVQYDDIKLSYTFYRDTLKFSFTFLLNE